MNNDELYQLLIDYAEGTLDETGRKRVEAELKKSHKVRMDLELLRSTLGYLQHQDEESVPNHYFSSFLPRVREKIEQKKEFHRFIIPLWLQKVSAPLSAVAVLVALFGMYNLFMPDTSQQELSLIVRETEQKEVDQLVTIGTPFEVVATTVSSSTFNSQILADELLATASLYENVISDVQILSQLDEQDVELIVRQLGTGSAR